MRNLALVLTFCCLPIEGAFAGQGGSEGLAALRAASAANRAALRTLVLEETVAVFQKRGAAQQAALGERLWNGYEALTEQIVERLWETSTTPEEETRAAVEAVRERRDGAAVESFLRLWTLNGLSLQSRRTAVDFSTGRYRREIRDLRDLDALAAQNCLSELERANLDLSKTVIGCPEYSLLVNARGDCCLVGPKDSRLPKRQMTLLGLVPQGLLNGPYEVTLEQTERAARVRGQWPETRRPAFLVELEPGCEGRFALRHRGKGVCIVLSDFLDKGGYADGFRYLLSRELDLYAIQVLSPEEIDPTLAGDLKLVDVEDDDVAEITASRYLLDRYKQMLRTYCTELKDFCTRRGITYLFASTRVPFDTLVLTYLRQRGLLR